MAANQWIGDYLHSILGYSEGTMEQYVVNLAKKNQMKTPSVLEQHLVEQLEFPEGGQTTDFATKLFQVF